MTDKTPDLSQIKGLLGSRAQNQPACWMLFAISAGKAGKKAKRPVRYKDREVKDTSTNRAACLKLEQAVANRDLAIERAGADVLIGYLPKRDSAWIVIDLDDALDEYGLPRPWVEEMLEGAKPGYIERSTSGTGLHILMPRREGDEALHSMTEQNGVGIFTDFPGRAKGKGVALTFDVYEGNSKPARDDELLERLVARRGDVKKKREKVDSAEGWDRILDSEPLSLDELRELLSWIPNDGIDRVEWVGMSKAVKEHFAVRDLDDEAFEIFDEWTETRADGGEHDVEANRRVWDENSAHPGSKTMRSLFWKARENGFVEFEANRKLVAEPEDEIPEDVLTMADMVARFAIVDGEIFDMLENRVLAYSQFNSVAGRATVKFSGSESKASGKPDHRTQWIRQNACHFSRAVFKPGQGRFLKTEDGRTAINRWVPPKPPAPGDETPDDWIEHCRLMLGDEQAVLLWDYLTLMLNGRGQKIGYALVLFSHDQGVGKDIALAPIRKWFGDYHGITSGSEIYGSNFQPYLDATEYLTINEMYEPPRNERQRVIETLKAWTSTHPDKVMINIKNRTQYEIDNIFNIIITTNNIDGVTIVPGERRFLVLEAQAPVSLKDAGPYYRNIGEFSANRARRDAVIQWLMERQPEKLRRNVTPPTTAVKATMEHESLPDEFDMIEEKFGDRKWCYKHEVVSAIVMGTDRYRDSKKAAGRAAATCMRALGFEEHNTMIDGKKMVMWVRKGVPMPSMEERRKALA